MTWSIHQMWITPNASSHFTSKLILHINMTVTACLVPRLNASTFFFTLARFLDLQAVALPPPPLSPSKLFLAIFTNTSHQVILCVESSIHVALQHFTLASSKCETKPYAIPYVSFAASNYACLLIDHDNLTMSKPLNEFHLHCCLVFELDCFHNNTSFWLCTCKSITYEIINVLSNTQQIC